MLSFVLVKSICDTFFSSPSETASTLTGSFLLSFPNAPLLLNLFLDAVPKVCFGEEKMMDMRMINQLARRMRVCVTVRGVSVAVCVHDRR